MTDTKEYNYIFYVFICNDPNITDCYVGSTRAFRQRKSHHKYSCNNENDKGYNYKIYQTIRANGGWNNWEMKPIDTKVCTTLEAHIHETKLMEERNATLNSCRAYISIEQREIELKEQLKQWKLRNRIKCSNDEKIRREKNRDKINARKRELYALKKAEENK